MTLGRCPLSIFCSCDTPPVEPTDPESIIVRKRGGGHVVGVVDEEATSALSAMPMAIYLSIHLSIELTKSIYLSIYLSL